MTERLFLRIPPGYTVTIEAGEYNGVVGGSARQADFDAAVVGEGISEPEFWAGRGDSLRCIQYRRTVNDGNITHLISLDPRALDRQTFGDEETPTLNVQLFIHPDVALSALVHDSTLFVDDIHNVTAVASFSDSGSAMTSFAGVTRGRTIVVDNNGTVSGLTESDTAAQPELSNDLELWRLNDTGSITAGVSEPKTFLLAAFTPGFEFSDKLGLADVLRPVSTIELEADEAALVGLTDERQWQQFFAASERTLPGLLGL